MTLMTISQSPSEAYIKHKITPDVVDNSDTKASLTIDYGNQNLVTLGNTLKVDDTQDKPLIKVTLNTPTPQDELCISKDDRFALVLTDPDAPSNSDHKWSEYAHWIITDIQLSSLNSTDGQISAVLDYSKVNELLPYVGPAPPEKTGKHRYVFLLFKQDPSVKYIAPSDRPNWGTGVPGSGYRDWIKKHGGTSQLIAINFFYAQNAKQ